MEEIAFTSNEQSELARLGVESVILFGSRAQGIASTGSDIDIGVVVSSQLLHDQKMKKQMYDLLYDLISKKINKLMNIDIVFLDAAPMELQSHVATHGVPLYQKDDTIFPKYKEQVMRIYADFAPLREMFQQATLARIP